MAFRERVPADDSDESAGRRLELVEPLYGGKDIPEQPSLRNVLTLPLGAHEHNSKRAV